MNFYNLKKSAFYVPFLLLVSLVFSLELNARNQGVESSTFSEKFNSVPRTRLVAITTVVTATVATAGRWAWNKMFKKSNQADVLSYNGCLTDDEFE